MAKYALVNIRESRVQAIANSEEERFDVHPDNIWHECPPEVDFMWNYNWGTGEWSPPLKPETRYEVARKVGYGDIGAQLGQIYDAMQSADATAALSNWAANIERVKILFPKDNHAAMQAANDELSRRIAVAVEAHEADPDNPANKLQPPDIMTQRLAIDYIEGRWINPVSGPYTP